MTNYSPSMRMFLAPLLAALLLTSCSGDGDDSETDEKPVTPNGESATEASGLPRPNVVMTAFGPRCDSIFVEGVVMVEEAGEGCLDGPRGVISPSTSTVCADGRTLVENEFGFGLIGEALVLSQQSESPPAVYENLLRDCLED